MTSDRDRLRLAMHNPMLGMLARERLKGALPNSPKADALANLLDDVRLESRHTPDTLSTTLEMQLWFKATSLGFNEFYVVRNEYVVIDGSIMDWTVALDALLQVNADLLLQLAVSS